MPSTASVDSPAVTSASCHVLPHLVLREQQQKLQKNYCTVAAGSGARKIKRYYLLVLSTKRQYLPVQHCCCSYSTAANEREVSIRWLKHRVMFYIFYYRALKLP